MKNRVRVSIYIIIIAIIIAAIMIISNVRVASVGMATVPGSYGEKYAKSHHLKSVTLSDDQKDYFDQRFEDFDYNFESGGIIVERYSGESENLVIPLALDGEIVIGIGEDFFKSLSGKVKNVYLPETILLVEAEPTDRVTIYCTNDSIFKALEGGNEWKIETRYESQFVNFFLDELEYNYNVSGNEIEITNYTGNYVPIAVIPSHINGVPVRKLSLDMLGSADAFVIPDTVTSITGMTTKMVYGFQFAVQLIFTILAFALALLFVNIILPRFKKDNTEYMLSAPQVIVTIIYVILQALFCIVTIYFIRIPALLSIVVSALLLIVFLAVSFLGGAGREHSKEVSQKIEENTSFMKNLKESTKYLADGIEDEEAKRVVEKLVEEIRFSKLNGKDESLDNRIGSGIDELKNKIRNKEYEGIKEDVDEIISLLRQR